MIFRIEKVEDDKERGEIFNSKKKKTKINKFIRKN